MHETDEALAPLWWRKAAATMVYVERGYERLPLPGRLLLGVVPLAMALWLGLPPPLVMAVAVMASRR